jgi:hypothetical protein
MLKGLHNQIRCFV